MPTMYRSRKFPSTSQNSDGHPVIRSLLVGLISELSNVFPLSMVDWSDGLEITTVTRPQKREFSRDTEGTSTSYRDEDAASTLIVPVIPRSACGTQTYTYAPAASKVCS